MLILAVTALIMCACGLSARFVALRWSTVLAPRLSPGRMRTRFRRHPLLAEIVDSDADPAATTGMAVTAVSAILVAGVVGFGVLLLMVRTNLGFARFDLGAAQFAGRHASATSTSVLKAFSQLGGAVVLVPIAIVVAIAETRRRHSAAVFGFLLVVIGGQYAVVNLVKWLVHRARPDIDRLTGFSGSSFPSGHAATAAASFAAFALLAGMGRSPRAKTALAAIAVAVAVGIACTRVFLGVHWLTDVLAGLALGWAWFAVSSIAFGGRLLRFGAPVEQAQQAAEHVAHVEVDAEVDAEGAAINRASH